MPRGTFAFIIIASLILAMSMLNAVGYYAEMGSEIDVSGQNDDVQAAASNLDGIGFGEGRSSAILQGPLAAVVPVVDFMMSLVTVINNTSGVLQLLYGVPAAVADRIQTVFRLMMLITMGYLIRSGSPI